MNTDAMFSSKTDLWATPQDFFDNLNREFDFNLDVCALPENAKCKNYYTPEIDGLSQQWGGASGVIRHTVEKSRSGYKKVLSPHKPEQLRYV